MDVQRNRCFADKFPERQALRKVAAPTSTATKRQQQSSIGNSYGVIFKERQMLRSTMVLFDMTIERCVLAISWFHRMRQFT